MAVCKDLSEEFGLHFLHVGRSSRSALHGQFNLAAVRSKRRRTVAERTLLDRIGDRVRVYELQGDLIFSSLELVTRRVVEQAPKMDLAVMDMRRVTRVDPAATGMLLDLCVELEQCQRPLLFASVQRHPAFQRALEERLASLDFSTDRHEFADLDSALEWCENRLLRAALPAGTGVDGVSLADQEICRGLSASDLAALEKLLERKRFGRGEFIVRRGEAADAMYLLLSGQASVVLTLPSGQLKRLATIAPGMVFGELAVVNRQARSADIRVDHPADCYVLSVETFEQLGTTHPQIKLALLQNMLRQSYETVTRLNGELAALDD